MVWARFDADGYFTGIDTAPHGDDYWQEFDTLPDVEKGKTLRLVNGVLVNEIGVSSQIKKERQDEAHKAAWQYIYDSGHDQGGLMQFINWKFDSLTPQDAKDKISAIETWKDAVMSLYFSKKAAIWSNQPYDLDYSSAGVCPFSFTEVMESI